MYVLQNVFFSSFCSLVSNILKRAICDECKMECVILVNGFSIFCFVLNDATSWFCAVHALTTLGDVKLEWGA